MKYVMKSDELIDAIKTLGVIKDESVSVCVQPTKSENTALITIITNTEKGEIGISKVYAEIEEEVSKTVLELGIEFIAVCNKMAAVKDSEITLDIEGEKDKIKTVTLTDGKSHINLDIKEKRDRQIPKVDQKSMLCQMEIQTSSLRDALEKVMWSCGAKSADSYAICFAISKLADESYKVEIMTTDKSTVSLIEVKGVENISFSEAVSNEELLKYCFYPSITDFVKSFSYDKCRLFITNNNMGILQNGPSMIHLPLSSYKMPYTEMCSLLANRDKGSTVNLLKEDIQYAIAMIEVADYDRSISNIALNIEKHEDGYFLVSPNGKVKCPLKATESGAGQFEYVSYKLDKLKAMLGALDEKIAMDVIKPEVPTFFHSTDEEQFILMPCKKYVAK